MESERQAGFAPAAPLDGDHCDNGSLAALEVREVAAGSVGGAGVVVFIHGCDHVHVRLQGRVPGHMAHVAVTPQGHVDTGGRAGACGEGNTRGGKVRHIYSF